MKLFEIVDMNANNKSFLVNMFIILLLGMVAGVLFPMLNHFVLVPLFDYEIEKYLPISIWAAGLGIYIGMCLQKSNADGGLK